MFLPSIPWPNWSFIYPISCMCLTICPLIFWRTSSVQVQNMMQSILRRKEKMAITRGGNAKNVEWRAMHTHIIKWEKRSGFQKTYCMAEYWWCTGILKKISREWIVWWWYKIIYLVSSYTEEAFNTYTPQNMLIVHDKNIIYL